MILDVQSIPEQGRSKYRMALLIGLDGNPSSRSCCSGGSTIGNGQRAFASAIQAVNIAFNAAISGGGRDVKLGYSSQPTCTIGRW